MESQSSFNEFEQDVIKWQRGHRRAKIAAGILIIIFGTLFLLHRLDFPIPHYFFGWQMILIGVGFVSIIRHKFKKAFGYILMLIGGLFLFQSWYPQSFNKEIILPVIIIIIGLMVLFKPKKKHWKHHHRNRFSREQWQRLHEKDLCVDSDSEDYMDSVTVFSGMKKNVTSQNFKGADIVTIFGGSEINFANADFQDTVVVDIVCVFAGANLNIPNNWQIKSDVTTIFGNIEDKRPTDLVQNAENKKVVILRGTCLFGGIDITSFSG